jgi:hypothetical protein
MADSIIKKYILIFFLTFVGYSAVNWLIATQVNTGINEEYLDFPIPFLICYAISYFIFRPLLKRLKYKKKTIELLWFLLPLTMWYPIAFSQPYFRNISYKVIAIDKPKDIDKYHNEKFFTIKQFTVDAPGYSLVKEKHTSGRGGTTLIVNSYFPVPVFDDTVQKNNYQTSKIGYGVKFSTSLNNSIFSTNGQENKMAAFWQKSREDFNNYNFHDAGYFERIKNTDDARYFLEAAGKNESFDKTTENIILINRGGAIQDLFSMEKKIFVFSTMICLCIGLATLSFVNRYQAKAR